MKKMSAVVVCFAMILLFAPVIHGQDLSKYRNFSFGTSLANVLKRTDQKMADIKMVHRHPALIQELTWWPPSLPGTTSQPDAVQQILFSFYNGELYRISVTYDRGAVEGLTAEDMVRSISTKYGPPIKTAAEADSPTSEQFDLRPRAVASWEDSNFSFNLIRSSYSDGFGMLIYSKRLNAEADAAIAEAMKLEEQERPQKEAERRQKETDNLEVARQKNIKTFHP